MAEAFIVCLGLFLAGTDDKPSAKGSKKADSTQSEPAFGGKPLSHWVAALKEADPKVRIAALLAIARIGPKAASAIPEVIELLVDQNFQVIDKASECLIHLGPEAVRDLVTERLDGHPMNHGTV